MYQSCWETRAEPNWLIHVFSVLSQSLNEGKKTVFYKAGKQRTHKKNTHCKKIEIHPTNMCRLTEKKKKKIKPTEIAWKIMSARLRCWLYCITHKRNYSFNTLNLSTRLSVLSLSHSFVTDCNSTNNEPKEKQMHVDLKKLNK